MSNLKRPDLKLTGNVSKNFKNFELRFNDYCIQADYRDLVKDPATSREAHYKSPLLKYQCFALHFLMKHCLYLDTPSSHKSCLKTKRNHGYGWISYVLTYTGTSGSSLLSDRFKFWTSSQMQHESIQEWEVKVKQADSLCGYGQLSDELCRDKFIFGLNSEHMRTELLKTHVKPDDAAKTLSDVVAEATAIESATQANQPTNSWVCQRCRSRSAQSQT